jgi:hypothetical protein
VVVSPQADGVTFTRTPTSNHSDEYVVSFADVAVGADARSTARPCIGSASWRSRRSARSARVWWPVRWRLTADYVATREQFGRPLSTFQTVAAQLAEVYIASRTIALVATSVAWRLAEGLDADEDLEILGYWLTSQAPPAMRICHHLHGGMGMDITYPMDRYYSSIKDRPGCWVDRRIAWTWWESECSSI